MQQIEHAVDKKLKTEENAASRRSHERQQVAQNLKSYYKYKNFKTLE
jgi:hypothetical protein